MYLLFNYIYYSFDSKKVLFLIVAIYTESNCYGLRWISQMAYLVLTEFCNWKSCILVLTWLACFCLLQSCSLRSCVDTDEFTSEEPEADVHISGNSSHASHCQSTARLRVNTRINGALFLSFERDLDLKPTFLKHAFQLNKNLQISGSKMYPDWNLKKWHNQPFPWTLSKNPNR